MSRKHVVSKFDMMSGLSATTTQTSVKTNVEQLDSASIHIKFSAPNTGTLVVEARNGVYPEHESELNWYELAFGAPLSLASETEAQILLKEMPFSEIRVKWVPSSGAGTMNAYLSMKVYGA